MSEREREELKKLNRERQKTLRLWWVEQFVSSPLSLTETMTHFWHDHFATGMKKVRLPQAMYRQNALFRRHALGNFRTLVREVAADPAMLIWLDGRQNRVGNPNENFARELLELFTMGEGSGYTQEDVAEAARACTGWVTDGLQSYFRHRRFDGGRKTILGHTGPWNLDDLVAIIFEQDAPARHLSRKLYRWFLDDEPTDEDVEYLARVLRENAYELAPVLQALLGSAKFMDPAYRGALIRDGVDFYAGQIRRFHIEGFEPARIGNEAQAVWVLRQMRAYEHVLFDPPNVAGWPGGRTWINTTTLPNRKLMSTMLVQGRMGRRAGLRVDVMKETARFSDPEDPRAVVDDLALLCFGAPPTSLVRRRMVEALLQGAEAEDWSLSAPDAEARLRDLYAFAMRLPDYQLK
jgi:uncharacterized protein (DUF1800 family)